MSSSITRRNTLAGLAAAGTLPMLVGDGPWALAADSAAPTDLELAVFWPVMNIRERSALAFPDIFPELIEDVRRRYGAHLKLCRELGVEIKYLHPNAAPTKDYQMVFVPTASR